ncbi:hypothetical protein KJ836_03030 [Patescibacteria group bacterium]|nr:hypothetical protein [Patescibacteria group bacterium]
MPELPEVETVVRGLSRHIVGQSIKNIKILNKGSFYGTSRSASWRTSKNKILGLKRRGKGIIIELAKPGVAKGEDGPKGLSLLIHLKMTGQLIYTPRSFDSTQDDKKKSRDDKKGRHSRAGGFRLWRATSPERNPERLNLKRSVLRSTSYGGLRRLNLGHPTKDFVEEMPSSHTRVIFELSKGTLYFNDQRKFGWVKLVLTKDVEKDKFISKLGVEPLSRSFNNDVLWQAIQRHPNSPIKSTIMDQSLVTGVGNIYSDEALFVASIRPDRKGKTITPAENKKLASAIKKVLELGIKHAGTSIANYKNAEGLLGRMQNYLKVYGRKNLSCPRKCGLIKNTRIGGRSAHFCPICQK